jgi:two-component system nitrogen regulation sensor histidine kinase NtrY
VASSLALLATSRWLIATSVQYLVVAAIATALAAALLAPLHTSVKRLAAAALAALALGLAIAGSTQYRLARLDDAWTAERDRMQEEALDELTVEVAALVGTLRAAASDALRAPPDRALAFDALAAIARHDDVALTVYHDDTPVAWHGRPPIATDALDTPIGVGVTLTTFHLAMYAVARDGSDRAVAVKLLYAVPPADALSGSAGETIAQRTGVRGFRFGPPGDTAAVGGRVFRVGDRALFSASAIPYAQGEMRLHVVERARLMVGLLLCIALACFVLACWRARRSLAWRSAVIGVALACVALTPLSAFSNYSRLFNPALYFTPLGGPLTANAAALGLTSALVLLLLLAALRRGARWNRWVGVAVVLVVAGLGPFLLRDLARGIQIPAAGVSVSLWLIWEVPLFLAAVCVILTGAAGGTAILGASRGLPAFVAPSLAAVAAVIAPVVWGAPGQWPWWYTFLWIAAIVSLAVSRRSSALILSAATVAALGATTLVWGSTMRARVRLAEQDVTMLGAGDPDAAQLAERFARQLADDPPTTKPELLRSYARSDLSAAAYPTMLSIWRSPDAPAQTLTTAPILVPNDSLRELVLRASRETRAVAAPLPGVPALQYAVAIPVDSGVLTLVVSPRSRLIPYDPFATLLGLDLPRDAEPPYSMQLASVASARVATRATWRREGNELHGDWTARTGSGAQRVHVEVELRPIEALIQRGTLIVLLDLGAVGLLWLMSIVADGVATRWISVRRRRWARSYRVRLTVALFGFFMVPAIAFAIWSYQQLSTDASRARELLVRETLRSVEPLEATPQWLSRESRRVQAPLLLYNDGILVAASDTLLLELAPVGRMLAHQVAEAMLVHGEVSAHRAEEIGSATTLFGYRAMDMRANAAVLAAPARADELSLGRRARDLGILVAFATALGALAALWLSGIAARQLARPIGSLRRAALAIAAGERDPLLEGRPTAEFLPVFAAFRRMTADLNASRSALEEAQRRTAAVLRNAASGVIAIDDQAVVTLANPRADELLGAKLPPGTRLEDVGPADLLATVQRFLAGGRDEEEFEMPHGQQQWRGRLARLSRGGAVLTLDDVSEIARAERVLAWGEMARQVAHEIKNPLTPIRLGVQHLRRARADKRVDFDTVLEQNVERILREIDHLDEIARAFSRYGQPPENRAAAERTDVAAVLRELVELETMGDSGVRWVLEGASAPVFALARREELREVLLNVLENARLAGAGTVTARVASEGDRVSITVSDDGHGVAPEALSRLFEPHFSTRTSGSGLGLAISRRLIESWGGTIGLESAPGSGATVRIELRT